MYLGALPIAVAAVIAPLCHGIPVPTPLQYRNVDYQFTVSVPSDLRACMNSPPCPNHGVWFPLDGSSCTHDTEGSSQYIAVNANYNAAGEADTAERLASIECRWEGAKDIVWLRDETISARPAAGCRRHFADGHIEVTYLVLRKTDHSPLQWIEISADLITTPARYEKDMGVFRRVLPGIWVHPDGPHY